MSKPISNPFLFVGNQIKDEYGRQIGRVASFKVTPTGRIDGIFVEHGDGEFFPDQVERILEAHKHESSREICHQLQESMLDFDKPTDDVSVVTIKFTP